ncbi:MAG: DUF1987 domain-containing protein [Crocinitomicaceae bacterium]|nr:DUF1987 domain-containing protein [Crocinitomicaceae bacterium]MBK6953398.1 DUF1987 domain-containing protein [Crocinitomicaceae bacterium]
MSDFVLKGSTKTPEINFSQESGLLELSGRSIPEISFEFYQPIIAWVDDYGKNPKEETEVHAKFEYFNTSSSKQILDIFKKLEQLHANGKSRVKVKWFIAEDDEAMEEAGEEYRMLLTMPFEIVPVAID